ncbi:TetR/AcrR family transcriptional regulator [Amycolatopsis acidicola]|uniref:TetR/AcrR family transcriptional regulator n=1 Tax=Amycolatopsis acidicola TaxID=2596893 RepID=A0A5N0VNK6_9PSEU|nr:TetR/AcrR family transcriptional regulator [Amycolatopsis acidicola]KAA9166372.1 TetR/AcrR family transcriptional regulator [Amycolatopsis acidicola]
MTEVSTRDRILEAAATLLADQGRDALSTRAVSAAAGVQAPTLYRLFGDKDGLLDALAAYGFETYLADKTALGETDDPVEDLRRGWDLHLEFGLARPAFYELMYGNSTGTASPAGQTAEAILRRMITRIADAGRLTTSVDRAVKIALATGIGLVFTINATPPAERDPGLPGQVREMVIGAITTARPSTPDTGVATRASSLSEALRRGEFEALSAAEQRLLIEWLTRLANT